MISINEVFLFKIYLLSRFLDLREHQIKKQRVEFTCKCNLLSVRNCALFIYCFVDLIFSQYQHHGEKFYFLDRSGRYWLYNLLKLGAFGCFWPKFQITWVRSSNSIFKMQVKFYIYIYISLYYCRLFITILHYTVYFHIQNTVLLYIHYHTVYARII